MGHNSWTWDKSEQKSNLDYIDCDICGENAIHGKMLIDDVPESIWKKDRIMTWGEVTVRPIYPDGATGDDYGCVYPFEMTNYMGRWVLCCATAAHNSLPEYWWNFRLVSGIKDPCDKDYMESISS